MPHLLIDTTFSVDGNIVSGIAIHPIKTYHPNEFPELRVYLKEELKKAASSLKGKPFGLDHQKLLPAPNIITNSYYDDLLDGIRFQGYVSDDIKRLIKNGTIKGVSVELNWMYPGGALKFVDGVAPINFVLEGVHFLTKFQPGDPSAFVELLEALKPLVPEIQQRFRRDDSETWVRDYIHRIESLGLAEEKIRQLTEEAMEAVNLPDEVRVQIRKERFKRQHTQKLERKQNVEMHITRTPLLEPKTLAQRVLKKLGR